MTEINPFGLKSCLFPRDELNVRIILIRITADVEVPNSDLGPGVDRRWRGVPR
jgi:hypothetical protein